MDSNIDYLDRLGLAIDEAKNLNFEPMPLIGKDVKINNDLLNKILYELNYHYIESIEMVVGKKYWGQSCIEASAYIFALINCLGIKADVVIGEVNINGTYEYGAELKNLIDEYCSKRQEGAQFVHVWVSIGGDTIIDATISDRIKKLYPNPPNLPKIIVSRSLDLSKKHIQHIPLLVGIDFITQTNPVVKPINWLKDLMDQRNNNSPLRKVGRNEECLCLSGKKYKNCHGRS